MMKNTFKSTLKSTLTALLMIVGAASSGGIHASTIIADWNFGDASQTTLNNTVNSGVGSSWGTAITGIKTDGTGLLNINNDGQGGSGTRSAYTDFDSVTSGMLSLYTRFASWNPAGNGTMQSFTMGFIEGNDFSTAEFSLAATDSGYTLSGGVDAFGDGTAIGDTFSFSTWSPITVRLDVDLDLMRYLLAYDNGNGFVSIGSASIDSLTQGINSLRLSVDGDFANNPLSVDRVWVEQGRVSAVPEPGSLAMMLAGVMLLVLMSLRGQRRHTRG